MRIDIEKFRGLAAERWVSVRTHPSGELLIWNYTPRCVYDSHWTPETRMCRGLITTLDGLIVSRPFEKFFSVNELERVGLALPAEPFEIYEKLDGSLAITYPHGGKTYCSSRGSFESDQAIAATGILHERYGDKLDPALTFCFEVIYPENRIVVDYGDRRDLVLLAVFEAASGRELPVGEFANQFSVVRRLDAVEDFERILSLAGPNDEGFVVRFASGFRAKLKTDEYKRLHRLLTGITPRHIWECLRDGISLDELFERAPAEYAEWVRGVQAGLMQDFEKVVSDCKADLAAGPHDCDRKTFAAYATTRPAPSVLFSMYDEKNYAPIVWRMIYPKAARAFRCDES